MNDNSKLILALFAGAAVGAAMGLLLAPDKGSDTRDKLSDALKNLGDTIKDRAAEEIENLTAMTDRVVDTMKSKFNEEKPYEGVPNPSTTQSESYSS